jgi:hypothetical protein
MHQTSRMDESVDRVHDSALIWRPVSAPMHRARRSHSLD